MRKFINSLSSSGGSIVTPPLPWLIVVQAGQSNAETNSSLSLVGNPPDAQYTGVQSNVIKTTINIPNWGFEAQQYNVNNFCRWNAGSPNVRPISNERAGIANLV